ncbi:putative gustatory receptor 28b [Halictus rubicundus]|uniref:putative gustatory receptor 28b n=1 Tax=Halictus rubicundus TaxID=77578 RepID=UPI004035D20F
MFHLTFKIVGFSTISLHDSNPKKNQPVSFAKSKFGIFYNVLLSCATAGYSLISLPELASQSYVNKSPATLTIEMVQSTYAVLMMCTILLYYAFRWSTLNRICNYLVQIEGEFSFSRERISLQRTFGVLLAVHTIQTVMFVIVLVSEEVAFHNGPTGWSLDAVPTAFAANIFFQYFSVISLMTVNFARANRAFENLCRSSHPEDCSKSLNRCRRVFVNCSIIQSLRRLRSIYDDLCYVCTEISQFYSFPMLVAVPYTIYSLLFNTYYLLQPLFDNDMYFDPFTFLNTVALIVYLVYPLGVLTSKVTDILDEIGKTGVIVHSLLKNAIDREAKSELKEFSLQLLHRQIKFTASQYFDLDNSLFQSVSKQT